MDRQIFQAADISRWTRFRWTVRIALFIMILFIVVFVIMFLTDKSPKLPFNEKYRTALTASRPLMQETRLSKEYKGFRDVIKDRKMHSNVEKQQKERSLRRGASASDTSITAAWNRFPAGIRSAFYVAWDPQSFFSLKRNIHSLNLVIPEWFFIDPDADTVRTDVDSVGFKLMKESGIAIMPMLSNNFNREFRREALGRILHDSIKTDKLIRAVLSQCISNGFVGINLDLEELAEKDNTYLTRFVGKLSAAFHKYGLLVTQDVMPFNDDYNIRELSKYNDYVFLMAYDEYSSDGDPGPIASQRWIEAALDKLAREMPAGKIVVGLGAYGYDWPGKEGVDPAVTYQQALSRANASGASIKFDNDTYNLSYTYKDDEEKVHQVFFTDAATQFNTMRFGTEYGAAGFALWRLGSEDGRLWKFYNHDLQRSAVSNFDFRRFQDIGVTNDVDYVGDGEVLDVLNEPHPGRINVEIDTSEMLIAEQNYLELPSSYQVRKYGQADPKKLVLTFDDGPDETYTPRILDILSRYHVPGVFFVVGLQAEKNLPILKRIYREGHEIGNHTFTHENIARITKDRANVELKLTRILIESVTGHSTILFRAPYNADSEPTTMEEIIPVALARRQNYLDIGENIDPEDWEPGISSDEIVRRVTEGVRQERGNIILLHDAGGETRQATVNALPRIIDTLQKQGYTFTNLSTILGKKKDDLMPPIEKGSGYYIVQMNLALATTIYWLGKFFYSLFVIFMVLGLIRLAVMAFLLVKQRLKEKKMAFVFASQHALELPLVSVIVPAYNEEINAVSSLQNLLKQDYGNFEIIFVDDGSKDTTYEKVSSAFRDHVKVRVLTKPNGGKASALNYGILQSRANYLVCIDADTQLYPDAISKLMRHFLIEGSGKQFGAVAGNVKVGNIVNLLTRWQDIEYTTSQNFDRMAYAAINAITVVPGAIGAFRKQAIDAAGGFTTDTLAEDCDLTIRILRSGYIIENENLAVAVTEAPEHLSQFMKQRTRWSFGVMQTFWKHRGCVFNGDPKGLSWWALPNMMIFQFIVPLFSPLADLLMLGGLISGNGEKIAGYYLLFMLVDISISVMAFLFAGEKLSKLVWIIPQRFVYRWIMIVVLFKSYLRAIKGELQSWGVLKRTGNVGELKVA